MGAQTAPNLLHLLIVEDSEDDAFLLIRQIKKGNGNLVYRQVKTLAEVREALTDEQINLVLSDYNLPGFNAIDVLKLVQKVRRELPVIIVSGAIGEELAVEAMQAGAADYIMKDNLARLNPAIHRERAEVEVHRRHQRAIAALRESEEHFRQLAGNIEGVFWLIDCRKNQLIFVSSAYEQIWEQSAAPLFERLDNFLDTVHPDDYARIQAVLAEKGWIGFNEEYRIQNLDGSERWISTRSFPIQDERGRIYRIAVLSTDITAQKRLEIETKKMSRALEQTADAVLITNRHGVIEYVNPAFEAITGYRRDEVLGKKPAILKSGLHDDEFYSQVWRTLLAGVPFSDVFVNRRKNGDLYHEAKTITPVRDELGDVTHFVATGKDITDRLRRQRHAERIVLYDELTGLANRILFLDRLKQSLLQAQRSRSGAALLFIGFDLSELFGEGDGKKLEEKLILRIARRLQDVVRESDAVARMGRDEFSIIQRDIKTRRSIEELARRIIAAFAEPIKAEGYELFAVPRVGISVFPDDGEHTDTLLKKADLALTHARHEGRIRYCFYQNGMKLAPEAKRTGVRHFSN